MHRKCISVEGTRHTHFLVTRVCGARAGAPFSFCLPFPFCTSFDGINHPIPSADEDIVELVAMLDPLSESAASLAAPGMIGVEFLRGAGWNAGNSGVGEL